jgi:hypothetical protein
MPVRVSIFVLAMLSVSTFGMLSTFLVSKIVDQVNLRLPADQRFSPLWWYPTKTLRLLREYRRLYPTADLVRRLRRVIMGAIASLVLGMLTMGGGWLALFFGLAAGTLQWFIFSPGAAEPPRAPDAGRASWRG